MLALNGFRGGYLRKIVATIVAIAFWSLAAWLVVTVLGEMVEWAKSAIDEAAPIGFNNNDDEQRHQIVVLAHLTAEDEPPPFMVLSA